MSPLEFSHALEARLGVEVETLPHMQAGFAIFMPDLVGCTDQPVELVTILQLIPEALDPIEHALAEILVAACAVTIH